MTSRRCTISNAWLVRQKKDPFVSSARQAGYRCRAAYKLLEIQKKYRLFDTGQSIVDLGAAPGGFSQVAKRYLGSQGHVYALDKLPMTPLAGVEFIQGDFTDSQIAKALFDKTGGQKIDVVISDMAPNLSGIKPMDQARSLYLAEQAFDFALKVLRPGGEFLVKVFEGTGIEEYVLDLKQAFESLCRIKPKASRAESTEIYLLARHFRANLKESVHKN